MRMPDSDRRSNGVVLLVALVIVSLIATTVYFREGDRGALHSLRKGTQAFVAPISSAGDWLFTPLLATRNFFGGLGVSREEIDALRQQNTELRASVAELEEARLENQRLQKIVGFVEAAKLESLGARVIGRPPSAWEGTLLIDRGTADGVKLGMPVLAPEGLLGQTVEVTEHSAKVRLITDQRSGVAALIQSTRAEGVASGSIEGRLSMEYVSRETTVTVGDIVLTSGMGGVYPKGLLVGEVASFELNDNDLFPRIIVRPTAQFDGIEEVVVLVGAVLQPDLGGTE